MSSHFPSQKLRRINLLRFFKYTNEPHLSEITQLQTADDIIRSFKAPICTQIILVMLACRVSDFAEIRD